MTTIDRTYWYVYSNQDTNDGGQPIFSEYRHELYPTEEAANKVCERLNEVAKSSPTRSHYAPRWYSVEEITLQFVEPEGE